MTFTCRALAGKTARIGLGPLAMVLWPAVQNIGILVFPTLVLSAVKGLIQLLISGVGAGTSCIGADR